MNVFAEVNRLASYVLKTSLIEYEVCWMLVKLKGVVKDVVSAGSTTAKSAVIE